MGQIFFACAYDIEERICCIDEALEYFNWSRTKSVKYSGYLLNHTKKLAIDLNEYYKKSIVLLL